MSMTYKDDSLTIEPIRNINYLKYYFKRISDRLFLDSIVCTEGVVPKEPSDFVKWYEEGDIEPLNACDLPSGWQDRETPLLSVVFAPRKVTFDW